jgi:hypothetical protein
MVCDGMISNCPVTVNAVKNAHQIFGPDLAGIRGRTVRRPPESVTTDYVDIMFVNGVPFLVSVARGLNLVTTEFTPSRTAHPDDRPLRSWRISSGHGPDGFLVINTTAAKEHVPEVECKIRLIKEGGRGILKTLLFKKIPGSC